jgi:hypothetical protein
MEISLSDFIVYDLEIVKAIPPKKGERLKGIEYCDGFGDFANMGIACVGWASNGLSGCFEFNAKAAMERQQFENLASKSVVVGFNSIEFDDRLAAQHNLKVRTNYDLLDAIRHAAYGTTNHKAVPKDYSYSLANIAKANALRKTEVSQDAPILWQKGERTRVIDYCKNDAVITFEVLRKFVSGDLIDPNTQKKLEFPGIDKCYRS